MTHLLIAQIALGRGRIDPAKFAEFNHGARRWWERLWQPRTLG